MHSSPRTSRQRLRRQFQIAVGALAVVLLVGVALIGRNVIASGGAGGSGGGASPHPSVTKHASPAGKKTDAKGSPLSTGWRGSGKPVTLAFGGDVHFEGPIATRLADDPRTALGGYIAKLMSGADISMTNFESALISGACTDPQPKQFVFHAPPSALTAFKAEHVTLVTEANNHGEDCGRPGLAQSLAIAKAAHFPIVGIGEDAAQAFTPYRTTVNGQRIAIFGATEVLDTNLITSWTATATQPGLASAYQEGELVAAVQQARRDSDTVVVFLHWGTETQECPNSVQAPLAKALVKAGADIVVGSHAHVELGAGYMGSALVDYGLGNLAFYDTDGARDLQRRAARHDHRPPRRQLQLAASPALRRPADPADRLGRDLGGAAMAGPAGLHRPRRRSGNQPGDDAERDAALRGPDHLAAGRLTQPGLRPACRALPTIGTHEHRAV